MPISLIFPFLIKLIDQTILIVGVTPSASRATIVVLAESVVATPAGNESGARR